MRVLLTLGILAMWGCAPSTPVPASKPSGDERPHEDFSQRIPLLDDPAGPSPEEETAVVFPEAQRSDG